jgi:hypothetical protein
MAGLGVVFGGGRRGEGEVWLFFFCSPEADDWLLLFLIAPGLAFLVPAAAAKLVFFFAEFFKPFSVGPEDGGDAAALSNDSRCATVPADPCLSASGGEILADLGGPSEPVRDFLRIGGRERA